MTRLETSQIMAVLQAAFPSFYRGISEDQAQQTISLWTEMFADDQAADVAMAVKSLISTQTDGFPPTIGAVKAKLYALRNRDVPDAQAAWHLVSRAAAGNLPWGKLPELARRAIGSENVLREWGMVDVDTFSTVIYSQFIKAYNIHAEREREMQSVPESIRQLAAAVVKALPEEGKQ